MVTVPQDTRWGDLGKGLGTLIGGVVAGVAQRNVQKGVSEIMSDPSISDNDKLPQITKKFGLSGSKFYEQFLRANQLNAQLKDTLAQSKLRDIQTQVLSQQLPFAGREAAAKVAAEEAKPAQIGAQTAETQARAKALETMLPGQIAQQGATLNKTQAETQEARERAGLTGMQGEILRARLDAMSKAGTNAGDTVLDTQLAPFGLTPQESAAAKMTYKNAELAKPGSGGASMSAYVRNLVTAKSRQAQVKATPGDEMRYASDTIKHAESADRFMKEFVQGGQHQLGFFSGANAKAWMERWGIPTGDPQIVDMWNAAAQQVQSTATSGGGFFAQGRVKLAHDVTAGIAETPLHALLATDQVADREIAALKTRISGFEGTSTNVKPLESALKKWQEVKAITGSFKSDVIPDAAHPDDLSRGRTVAFFQNAQIDPKSFKVLVKNDNTQYKLKAGMTVPGKWLFEAARSKNVDPESVLETLRQHGGR